MDFNATGYTSTNSKSTDAVGASTMSTVDRLQSFTLRDNGDDALEPEPGQDTDMDVDTPTEEATQANETTIDSSQDAGPIYLDTKRLNLTSSKFTTTPSIHQHAGTAACPNTDVLERKAICLSEGAVKPQHKHLKHLVSVDAKSKAPAAFSLDRVVAASVQSGSKHHPLQQPSRTKAKKSRLAQAATEALDQEA